MAYKKNLGNEEQKKVGQKNDFEFYCIVPADKQRGKRTIYKIPPELCRWREALISSGRFMEALEALKNKGGSYSFNAPVLTYGSSFLKQTEIKLEYDKNNPVKEISIKEIEDNHEKIRNELKKQEFPRIRIKTNNNGESNNQQIKRNTRKQCTRKIINIFLC